MIIPYGDHHRARIMSQEVTRYEKNQIVRRTLVRNLVDLSLLFFSSSRNTLNLYGDLKKTSGEDFSMDNVKNLVSELNRVPGFHRVNFTLNNWVISDDLGSWNMSRKSLRTFEPHRAEKVLVIEEEKEKTEQK